MKNYLSFENDIKDLESELEKLKDPYNQGGLSEVDTSKILKTQKHTSSRSIKVPYPKNYPSDEPMRRCPSIKTFTSEFKFKPKIKLKTGLEYFNIYAKKNFIQS